MSAESAPNCASYSAKLPTIIGASIGPDAVTPTNAVVEVGTPAMACMPEAASSTKTPGKRCSGMSSLLRRDGGARKSRGRRGAGQCRHFLAVDEDRRGGLLAGSGKRNADIGVLAFARPVDDAAHDRDVERLDAGIAPLPLGHRGMNEPLDIAGELLERRRGRASAARAGGDQRHENAKAHGLQQLLRHLDLERAIAAGFRRERNAYGIADALLQQTAQ